MKKTYVVPESRLFSINLNENIAASDQIYNSGDDLITATAVITFTHGTDPCREVYTDIIPVSESVKGSTSFLQYYNDLSTQVGDTGKYEAYFKCFKYVNNV